MRTHRSLPSSIWEAAVVEVSSKILKLTELTEPRMACEQPSPASRQSLADQVGLGASA